jgi:hypothetical protein
MQRHFQLTSSKFNWFFTQRAVPFQRWAIPAGLAAEPLSYIIFVFCYPLGTVNWVQFYRFLFSFLYSFIVLPEEKTGPRWNKMIAAPL